MCAVAAALFDPSAHIIFSWDSLLFLSGLWMPVCPTLGQLQMALALSVYLPPAALLAGPSEQTCRDCSVANLIGPAMCMGRMTQWMFPFALFQVVWTFLMRL